MCNVKRLLSVSIISEHACVMNCHCCNILGLIYKIELSLILSE